MAPGGHSSDLTHVLYHLGMAALAVAALYAMIFVVLRPLLRSAKGGERRGNARPGLNRRQRRQQRATKGIGRRRKH